MLSDCLFPSVFLSDLLRYGVKMAEQTNKRFIVMTGERHQQSKFIYLFNVHRYNTCENNNSMPLTGDNSTTVASMHITLPITNYKTESERTIAIEML